MSTPDARALVTGADLVYVSDYFSFVGGDAQGRVAFAIDTNRGRDGAAYQAEQLYAVLHDERRGWVGLSGTGRHTNPPRDLLPIPSSPAFQFTGEPATGLTIESPTNHLILRIEPIIERVRHADEHGIFALGSAPATLAWGGRIIPGRVIAEYLVQRGFNLMTRRSLKGLAEFQGLYLVAGSADDLYIQAIRKQRGEGPLALPENPLGFLVQGERTDRLTGLQFATTKHALAAGAYRWPTAWRVSWQGSAGPATLDMRLDSRTQVGNWFVVGFAMGVASGTLTYDGRETLVYGLAELLMLIGP